jgi:hypothetical protein
MPDISKCANEECPLKDSCYRWTSTPNEYWQSYGDFKHDEENGCEYYWEVKDND